MISRRGLETSTSSETVLRNLDDFSDRLLRIAPNAEEILSATEETPDEPSLQLATALFWLFGQTHEAQKQAATALQQVPINGINLRESRWLDALLLWHQKDFDRAAAALENLTQEWPSDLVAAKAAEFLYYVLGQQHNGSRFRAHMRRLHPLHGNDPDFLAMDAFAHELCGDGMQARRSAERALEITERNPWAQHALEHVLLWEGNPEAAIIVMERWVADWEASARPIHSHNAWHLALAHLDRMDAKKAFAVFDAHVWMKTPAMVVEQLDSIAFLWRAEMAGIDVSIHRWQALVPHIAPASLALFMPFTTAHYAYALARAGEKDAVKALLAATEERAQATDAEAIRVWAPTGQSIINACAALGADDAQAAVNAFDPSLSRLTEIGGSDAQNDLFRFAYIDSLRRVGRKADATTALHTRLKQKTASPLEECLLATGG